MKNTIFTGFSIEPNKKCVILVSFCYTPDLKTLVDPLRHHKGPISWLCFSTQFLKSESNQSSKAWTFFPLISNLVKKTETRTDHCSEKKFKKIGAGLLFVSERRFFFPQWWHQNFSLTSLNKNTRHSARNSVLMHIATLASSAHMKGCFVGEVQLLVAFLIRVEMMRLLQIFSAESSLVCSLLRSMVDHSEPSRTPSVCHSGASLGLHWHDCSRPKVAPQPGRIGNAAQNAFLTLLTPTSLASQSPLSGSCRLLCLRLCRRLHVHFHINTSLLLQGAWYLASESHYCSSSFFDQQTTQADSVILCGEKTLASISQPVQESNVCGLVKINNKDKRSR